MADLVVAQPALIDAQGNINVHGREGLSIPLKRYADASRSTQIDISGDSLTFEIEGLTPIVPGTDGNDPLGRLLVIADLKAAGIVVTADEPVPFVLRDATGAVPIVRWEGAFIVRGWED